MCTTLALLLALQTTPAQNSALTLDGDHFTYGYHGADRKEDGFLPGDVVFLGFNIRNMTFDPSGKAAFTIAMEILDGSGMSQFKQAPRNQQAVDYLGGGMLQSVADVQIPLTTKPGEFTIRLTITDRSNKASKTLERKVKVLPADFGIVHLHTSQDREGKAAVAPVGSLGEPLYINFAVVGFQRDDKKQPNIELTMRVLDEKGNPAGAQPQTGKADREVPESLQIIPLQFGLTLNRLGRFTVEMTASDKVSNKSSRISIPIRVMNGE
jgi:hypothetical protein